MAAESEVEVLDGVPVLREERPVVVAQPASGMAIQAAAVAGAGVLAGAAAIAVMRGAARLASGERRRRRRLRVVGTRTFLVDVHLVDRR